MVINKKTISLKQKTALFAIIITLAILAFAISVVGAIISAGAAAVMPSDVISSSDKAIRIENNKRMPNQGRFDKEVASRVGVQVTSAESDAEFGIKNEMSGMFEMAFRVFSSTDTVRDVSEFFITIADADSGRSFTIMMDSKATYTSVSTSVYIDNEKTKPYSFTNCGKDLSGNVNPDDMFRDADGVNRRPADNFANGGRGLFQATSFSNDIFDGDDRQYSMLPAMVNFDPQTMEVKIMTQDNWYRIINLGEPTHMANTKKGIMAGFERYNVSMKMTLAAPGVKGREGKVLIYSINGQQLLPALLSPVVKGFKNTAAPIISAKANTKWLKGTTYKVLPPLAYDVIDGYVTYDNATIATVTDPNGEAVVLSASNEFTPTKSGDYTVAFALSGAKDSANLVASADSYYAARYRMFIKNADGEITGTYNYGTDADPDKEEHANANPKYLPFYAGGSDGKVTYKLTVVDSRPALPQITVSGIKTLSEIAPNTDFVLPVAYANNPMGLTEADSLPVAVTVTLGTQPTFVFDNMSQAKTVKFTQEGMYTVTYRATDVTGGVSEQIFSVNVSNDFPIFKTENYSQSLARGAKFVAPTVTALANGMSVPVTKKVILPDGQQKAEDGFIAQMVGQYTVQYTCVINDKSFDYSLTINVMSTPASLFKAGEGATVTQNVNAPDYTARWDNKTKFNGIKITATGTQSTVNFLNPINLADNNKEQSLFEYIVTPVLERDDNGNVIYAYEFTTLSFVLTDAYDPTNFVTIKVRACTIRDIEYASLVQAAAGSNVPGGLGWDDKTFSTASYGGTNTTTSFHGKPIEREGVPDKNVHSGRIYFDYSTKEVFVDHTMGINGTAEEAIPLTRVIDFDDTKIVGAGNEWKGFTTGEVYVSITASELVKKSASYMMLGIDGISLAGDSITSGKPPVFSVNKDNQTVNPQGEKNTPFPIFKAKAIDAVDGELSLGAEVYYDYKGANQQKMNLSDDNNTFTPDKVGQYTIVYTSGVNVHTELVEVVEALPQLTYKFDSQPILNGSVGAMLKVPDGVASGGSGDNKKISLKITHMLGGKNQEVTVKNNIFFPSQQGTYVVKVTAQDYLGKIALQEYSVKVIFTPNPIITQQPSVPKVLQNGKKFVFPDFKAVDYASNKAQPMLANKQILVNGTALGADRAYTPTQIGDLNVAYKASAVFNSKAETVLNYTVKVVEYNGVQIAEYFYTYGGQVTKVSSETYSAYSTTSDGAGMQFANSLHADNFSFSFAIPQNTANFKSLKITLTDAQNANIQVTFNVQKFADDTYIYLRNKREGKLVGAFGDENQKFNISFNNKNFKLYNAAGIESATIVLADNGEQFAGFTSNKVYLDVSFEGVVANQLAGIQVSQLNGQMFTDILGDGLEPAIIIDGFITRSATIGSEVEIPNAVAYDVLDPTVNILITVRSPSNRAIIDSQPLANNMTFNITEYGSYMVIYMVSDSSGNVRDFPYTVSVPDKTPPVITILDNVPTAGKVNKVIKLPAAQVTDNHDNDIKALVFVLCPDGKMVLAEDYKFKPTQKGVHTVYYYAQDSGFSYAYRVFTVLVA